MSKISVVIPTYNREQYVKRAIESAQKQTYKNIEIIVCDDGSTDKTENTVKKFIKKDSRIKYFKIKHTGHPSYPRNLGIEKSKGKWIAFLDSDDYWTTDKIEAQLTAVQKHNINFICSNAYRNDNPKSKYFNLPSTIYTARDFIKHNPIITSTVLIKKNLFKKSGLFNQSKKFINGQDYELWMRLIHFEECLYIDKKLVHYKTKNKDSHSQLNRNPQKTIRNIFIHNGIWQLKHGIFNLYNPILYISINFKKYIFVIINKLAKINKK